MESHGQQCPSSPPVHDMVTSPPPQRHNKPRRRGSCTDVYLSCLYATARVPLSASRCFVPPHRARPMGVRRRLYWRHDCHVGRSQGSASVLWCACHQPMRLEGRRARDPQEKRGCAGARFGGFWPSDSTRATSKPGFFCPHSRPVSPQATAISMENATRRHAGTHSARKRGLLRR